MPPLAAFPKGFFDAIVERRMTVFEWINHAGDLELDGAELYPKFLDSFDSAYLKKVRAAAGARGLELPMFCNSPDFTQPDPADRKKEVERTRDMFRVTAELGGKYCRVLSGQNRPGLKEEEALKWVIDCLWELEPHAKAAGVVMCMENHYKDGLWQYPEFGEDPYALLDRVLPRVATMQASDRYLEGGTIEELRKMARDAQHGYAKFVKHGVIGQGLNDYDRIFGTLAKAGYSGWVSIEDGEGPTVEIGLDNLRRSAKFLREKFVKHFGGGGDE